MLWWSGGCGLATGPPARPPWKCFSLGDALVWIETASEALFFLREADGRTRVGPHHCRHPNCTKAADLHPGGRDGQRARPRFCHHLKPQDFPYLLHHS